MDVLYRERLAPPWTWWLLSVAAAATLAWVVYVATGPTPAVVTGVVTLVVFTGALIAAGRTSVTVVGGESDGGLLTVGRSRLELAAVGRASALDRDQARLLRGPAFDPLAHHVLRGWKSRAVRLDLADPRDPTPYWFVSCSSPELVVAAVARARGVATS